MSSLLRVSIILQRAGIAMLSRTRLLEAHLDVTLICTAGLVNNKNVKSSELRTLPIDAHPPLPTSPVYIFDASH
jgi:hypothetical protein